MMPPLMGGAENQMSTEVIVETPAEVVVTEVDPRDAHIKKLNDENAQRRVSEKKLKDQVTTFESMTKSVMEAFGVDKPEDLATSLADFRASKATALNPENDPKVLARNLSKSEEDRKRVDAAFKTTSEKLTSLEQKYHDRTVGAAIRTAIAERGVKPAFHAALAGELKSNVRLNENDEVMWIQRDDKGNEQYDVPVADGIAKYFEKNPDWLPSTGNEGSGAKPGASVPTKRGTFDKTKLDLDTYLKNRPELTGIKDPRPLVAKS